MVWRTINFIKCIALVLPMPSETLVEPSPGEDTTILSSFRSILSPADFYRSLQTGPEGIALAVYHGSDAFVFGGKTRPFELGEYCLHRGFTTTDYGTLPRDHVLIPSVMYTRLWLMGVPLDDVQHRLVEGLALPEAQIVPFNHNGFQDPESGLFGDFSVGSPLEFALMFEHHLLLTHKTVSRGTLDWEMYQHGVPVRTYQSAPAAPVSDHPGACSPCGGVPQVDVQ